MGEKALADRNILVVEDDYFLADQLREHLEDEGAKCVGPAPSVERALVLAGEPALEAAILDINLRGERAYGVADELSARGIPFIFVTGYDREELPPRFADAPICSKPFLWSRLIELLIAKLSPA